MTTDIGAANARISAEIEASEAKILERREQIEKLSLENDADGERVVKLREALTAVQAALSQIEAVEALILTAPAAGPEVRKRPRQKEIVLPIIDGAGMVGITVDEIISHAKRLHDATLEPASLRTFLYQARKSGMIEQREDKRWRRAQAVRQAAE